MTVDRFIGVDLAWGGSNPDKEHNETGVVVVDESGRVLDAGWTRGVDATAQWIQTRAGDGGCVVMVDAPLVVDNDTKQRVCEREVGQRYGRWKVSANSTNTSSPGQAGVALLAQLEKARWTYDSGVDGPAVAGRAVSECYPYTALVGAAELGYDRERPKYKRKPPTLTVAQWRPERARNCDELSRRLDGLRTAEPPLDLRSHPTTFKLIDEASPFDDRAYKHREDLLDAALAAWTALLWVRKGLDRCQVLGAGEASSERRRVPTIIAPARPEQRRPVVETG